MCTGINYLYNLYQLNDDEYGCRLAFGVLGKGDQIKGENLQLGAQVRLDVMLNFDEDYGIKKIYRDKDYRWQEIPMRTLYDSGYTFRSSGLWSFEDKTFNLNLDSGYYTTLFTEEIGLDLAGGLRLLSQSDFSFGTAAWFELGITKQLFQRISVQPYLGIDDNLKLIWGLGASFEIYFTGIDI